MSLKQLLINYDWIVIYMWTMCEALCHISAELHLETGTE